MISKPSERHSWLAAMLGSLEAGVIVTSSDGEVQFVNAAQVLTAWVPRISLEILECTTGHTDTRSKA